MFQQSIAITVVHECEIVRRGISAMVAGMAGMALMRELSAPDDDLRASGVVGSVVLTSGLHAASVLDTVNEPADWNRRPGVILVAASATEFEVREALRNGIQGMLLLSSGEKEVEDAIRLVASGRRYLSTDVATTVAEQMDCETLTTRELEILQGIAAGRANKAIAIDMNIAVGTVKSHVRSILAKLDAASRTHAVVIATQRGIVRPVESPRVARRSTRQRATPWISHTAAAPMNRSLS